MSDKLNVPQVIEYCKKTLGITFNLMGEDAASEFLMKNNYFFRLKQYAEICTQKTKSGKYVGLDFGHLVELSVIDMFFRKQMLKMTIDFEHYLKVRLVNDCQNNPADDGYEVVEAFLRKEPSVKRYIESRYQYSSYGGISFEKYVESPAVWNLVEMIGFHDFINFYVFYYDFFNIPSEYIKHLDSVRRLRNSSAHNACMLCSFKPVQNFKFDIDMSFELIQGKTGIGNGIISSSLKVPLLNDFTVMLSLYTRLVSSQKVKEHTLKELEEFFDGRMVLKKEYFENFTEVKNAYSFARKILQYYIEKNK